MSAYIVRLAGSREIVGLFTAPNLVMLCDAIDECCDPGLCESPIRANRQNNFPTPHFPLDATRNESYILIISKG